jgi:uncharacterized Zn-finger protein
VPETFNDMPFGKCPYCGHEWQLDDWYDTSEGDEWACPACEREFVITSVDHTVTMTFDVKQDAHAEGSAEKP